MITKVDEKRRKIIKRQGAKIAAKPLANTTAVAGGSSTITVPLTRLSFADIISGRLVKNLFDLH
jgi:hypothetical protein